MSLARAHDPALYRHSIVVSRLSASFSAFLKCPGVEQHTLARAGLLHDIGKIKIPAAILKQTFPLTQEELVIVRAHAQLGYPPSTYPNCTKNSRQRRLVREDLPLRTPRRGSGKSKPSQ
jgi:hypothetical protein